MKQVINFFLILLLPFLFNGADAQETLLPPVPIAPPSGQSSMSPPAQFIWNAVENAADYHLQITTDVTFMAINTATTDIDIAPYTDTLYAPENGFLDADTMYFWRVKARSLSGTESDWSHIQMFQTGVNNIHNRIRQEDIIVSPLPISQSAVISFDSEELSFLETHELQIFVFSSGGRLVDSLVYEDFSPIEFYAGKYFAGTYYLVFVAGAEVLGTKKVAIR